MPVSSYRIFSLVVVLLMLLSSLVATKSEAQFKRSDRPKRVVAQPLQFEYETTVIEAIGTAQARQSVILFASETEEVSEVHFTPGQSVKRGDILLEQNSRLQDIAIDRARIQLTDAKRNIDRIQKSVQKGAATQRELDDAQTALLLAQITLKEVEEKKEQRLIRAPFDGIVGLSDVEVGDRITPQTQITTLDNRAKLFIDFSIPEQAINGLLDLPKVSVQPWMDRTQVLSAEISQIDSRLNNVDRTLRVRALLDNERDFFRPGMSFRVSLTLQGERYFSIPEAALAWGTAGAYVWLSDNKTAKKVGVQVQQRLRGRILVSGDLQDSQLVIIEGIQSLREGQALSLVEASDQYTSQIASDR